MTVAILLLLGLLCWPLVNSQSFPYVSFHGQTLVNHSYVDLSLVGSDSRYSSGSDSDTVQCITDLYSCCSGYQGQHRGDWYFPDGTRLPIPASHQTLPIDEIRGEMRVQLRRSTATSPVGIYRCGIATNAVHDATDRSVRDTVYMGLYTGSGGMLISSLLVLLKIMHGSDSGQQ